MPVTINGTSGITNVDGTAAAPALTGTDTDTGIFFPAANTLAFSTNGTEDARFDSSGNLGIGTSSPNTKLQVNGNAVIGNGTVGAPASGYQLRVTNDGTEYYDFGRSASTGYFTINASQASPYRGFIWAYGGTSQMTLDSSGNLGIGTSSPNSLLTVQNGNILLRSAVTTGALSSYNLGFSATATGGAAAYITSYRENANEASSLVFGNWNGSTSAEKMRLDSSGNLGLGVTPSAWVSNFKAFQVGTGGTFYGDYNNTTSYFGNNAYFNGTNWKYVSSSYALYAYQDRSAGKHVWAVAASGTAGNNITWTEAMTLDSSGNLLVGTTSGTSKLVVTTTTGSASYVTFDGSVGNGINLRTTYASTGSTYVSFYNSASNNTGSINQNGTTTVAYTTSSDYRLKENIQPMQNALGVVAQLKPVTYTWKADGSEGQGFIAHELQAVVPDCVIGEKDAVDADGNPIYQGIDTSFLVATLTAAIKELKAEFDAYKATHP